MRRSQPLIFVLVVTILVLLALMSNNRIGTTYSISALGATSNTNEKKVNTQDIEPVSKRIEADEKDDSKHVDVVEDEEKVESVITTTRKKKDIITTRTTSHPVLSSTGRVPSNGSASNGNALFTETSEGLPRTEWYNELLTKNIGRKGGDRMKISLLSAWEYEDEIIVMITSRNMFGSRVNCHYFSSDQDEIGIPFESVIFPEYTIHCLKREGAAFMSLSQENDTTVYDPVPITNRVFKEPVHFFSVCLAPMYGNDTKWLMLAEFFEHYKLQGATHFYVYMRYMDEYSRVVLDDYERTGDVETIVLHDRFKRPGDRWQSVELQECLLRSRGHSKWVALVDLDERITPTEYNGTLRTFLEDEVKDKKVGSVQFRQRWIIKNDTSPRFYNETQILEWLPTNRYHNTSHVGPNGHTAKCIIDPSKVFIMFVHYVVTFYPGYKQIRVDPKNGVVRHYRDIQSGAWYKRWLKEVETFGAFENTTYPSKLFAPLAEKVQARLKMVYGGEKEK